jgi:hypothetical protein
MSGAIELGLNQVLATRNVYYALVLIFLFSFFRRYVYMIFVLTLLFRLDTRGGNEVLHTIETHPCTATVYLVKYFFSKIIVRCS